MKSNTNLLSSSDMRLLENQIDEKVYNINKTNDIAKLSEYKREIDNLVKKKSKIAGELSPKGSYLNKLIEERKEYENSLNSDAEYVGNSLGINHSLNKGSDFQSYFRYPAAANEFIDGRNLSELISDNDVNKIICAIPYMNLQEEDLGILREFLIAKLNQYMVLKNNYSSYYRKAVCFYDWKKFGW